MWVFSVPHGPKYSAYGLVFLSSLSYKDPPTDPGPGENLIEKNLNLLCKTKCYIIFHLRILFEMFFPSS